MSDISNSFQNPQHSMKSRPFFFIGVNAEDISCEELAMVMEKSVKESGYAGFTINAQFMQQGYLSESYFEKYGVALAKAEELGIKLCLYDENGCPSGAASGLFAEKYPEDTVKRLDKIEWIFSGPGTWKQEISVEGTLMGAVAMKIDTKELIDITEYVSENPRFIEYNFLEGEWRIMLFLCIKDGSKFVDYLAANSVKKFIELTHQSYYDRFSRYFGTVIDSAFYDEPAMMGEHQWMPGGRLVKEGRMWTPLFNTKFKERYNESPVLHYPALWYDIGENTHISRYKLTNLRAELFMEYVKIMADWCKEHGIELTGHMWEETLVNPSSAMGDLMKIFKYQHIPGLDSIFRYGHVSNAVKIISSAAYNWDKPLVMSETYGGFDYGESLKDIFYKEAMNQYAKGVNYIVPHSVFYTGNPDGLPPELSYRGPYKEELPLYNEYIARLNTMLQGGRHLADIAMLYPIVDLQSTFDFAIPNDRCNPPYSNYMQISEMLSLEIRQDFTYLHPEALLEKCVIDKDTCTLKLNNEINFEVFKVLILPSMETIDVECLEKIKEFYDKGGKIIAIGQLPSRAAQVGQQQKVQSLIDILFNSKSPYERSNSMGGLTWYIKEINKETLEKCLSEAIGQPDVSFGSVPILSGGELSYIHKSKDGREIYFIANSSESSVQTDIVIRNRMTPEIWNPHTGQKYIPRYVLNTEKDRKGISIEIKLEPIESLFIVG